MLPVAPHPVLILRVPLVEMIHINGFVLTHQMSLTLMLLLVSVGVYQSHHGFLLKLIEKSLLYFAFKCFQDIQAKLSLCAT